MKIARLCRDCDLIHWCLRSILECACPGCGSEEVQTA